MTVLISTIYKGSAVIQAIKLFAPTKIFFVVDDTEQDIRKNSVRMIKDLFPNIPIQEITVKIYDIVDIAREVMQVIEKENNDKIIVHISEGRKTMSLGLLFGAYIMRRHVDSVYYITEETNVPIRLPLVEFKVSGQKKDILQKINDGASSVQELESSLGIKNTTLYVQMKELRDDGFLNKDNKITDLGKMVLLHAIREKTEEKNEK